jgi:hypothetical protein
MSFTLLRSPFSVRVQVRFWVRCAGFGVRRVRLKPDTPYVDARVSYVVSGFSRTEHEHERRSEKRRRVNDAGAAGAGLP